jgi:hypothetical protein
MHMVKFMYILFAEENKVWLIHPRKPHLTPKAKQQGAHLVFLVVVLAHNFYKRQWV